MTLTMTRDEAEAGEAAVRDLLECWAKGVRAGDLERIMACYRPDVVAFDAIAALRFLGAEAYREHWKMCLSFAPGGLRHEFHDMQVAVSGDVAFVHYVAHCGGTGPNGKEDTCWARGTVGLRESAGNWLIVHEHYSMPFDPQTDKVMDNLAP